MLQRLKIIKCLCLLLFLIVFLPISLQAQTNQQDNASLPALYSEYKKSKTQVEKIKAKPGHTEAELLDAQKKQLTQAIKYRDQFLNLNKTQLSQISLTSEEVRKSALANIDIMLKSDGDLAVTMTKIKSSDEMKKAAENAKKTWQSSDIELQKTCQQVIVMALTSAKSQFDDKSRQYSDKIALLKAKNKDTIKAEGIFSDINLASSSIQTKINQFNVIKIETPSVEIFNPSLGNLREIFTELNNIKIKFDDLDSEIARLDQ